MNKYYEITKVTRWYHGSANATSCQEGIKSLEEALRIAKRQEADIDNILGALEEKAYNALRRTQAPLF